MSAPLDVTARVLPPRLPFPPPRRSRRDRVLARWAPIGLRVLAVLATLAAVPGAGDASAAPPEIAEASPSLESAGRPIPSGSLCGTSIAQIRRVLENHRRWSTEEAQLLPTTQSYDIGEIAVLEDDGTLLRPVNGQFEVDVVAVARAFYETHGDEYEFLAMFVASEVPVAVIPNTSAFAFEVNVVQDVEGIGLGLWDLSDDFGSTGTLHSFLHLNSLSAYPEDPFAPANVTNNTFDVVAHEAGHRWCAFVPNDSLGTTTVSLLGAGFSHWNFYFSNQASLLGGNEWQDNGDGTWTSVAATQRYGNLELYLMGYLPPDSVGALPVLYDATSCSPPGNYTKNHHPLDGVTCDVRPEAFTVDDVITANGPRLPDASATSKHERFAFVLVIPNGSTASAEDLAKLEAIRSQWPAQYSQMTLGIATADNTIQSQAGSVVVSHDGLPDSEDTASPYFVTARAEIDPGSIPLAIEPSSVTLHYGIDGGPLVPVAMNEFLPGLYDAAIPPQPLGTSVRYAVYAASDSSGIDAWWPGPDGTSTHEFTVATDVEAPSVAHLAEAQTVKHGMPPYRFYAIASDNLGLDRVVGVYTENGGAADSIELQRVALSDTFFVDLFPGAALGDEVTLSLRAVDLAAAENAGTPIACDGNGACTYTWSSAWIERLDVSDGGFVPSVVTPEFRDSWIWTDRMDATGRAAWKCGDAGELNYIADLDAGLVTPPIPVLQNAELRLRHRYDLEPRGETEAWDGALVEVSVGGGPWQAITPVGGYPRTISDPSGTTLPAGTPVYSGSSPGWESGSFVEAIFPLTGVDSATVRLRFRVVSDGFVGGGGWIVDDLALSMGEGVVDAATGPRTRLRFLPPQPNPAAGEATFRARLPRPGRLSLDIYDVRGRHVATVFRGSVKGGAWSARWSGGGSAAGAAGGRLSSGVYLARLSFQPSAGERETSTRRFVVLR